MIILTRRCNESIVINNDIVVTVVEIRGDKARLGIEAPRECPVHRQEVWAAIQQNEESQQPVNPPQAQSLPPIDHG